MTLQEVVRRYGQRGSASDFGIKGYAIPKQPDKNALSHMNIYKYVPQDPKKSKSYIKVIENHSKEIPAPSKYSKQPKWCLKETNKIQEFNKEARVTLFAKLGKENKKTPGPATYHGDKAKLAFMKRAPVATYSR